MNVLARMAQGSSMQGGCLVWNGTRTPDGYGQISVEGKKRYLHQLAYEATFGPIPTGKKILHSCDNPPCWLIEHLSVGTTAQNTKEGYERGQRKRPVERRIKRSLILDTDLIRWIEAQAAAADASDSYVVRRILRAAMDADERRDIEAVA